MTFSNIKMIKPLLKRLDKNSKVAIVLTKEQEDAIEYFRQELDSGHYEQTSLPCLCGGSDDILVAERDRYGLPVCTKLCRNCGLMRSDPYFTVNALEKFYDSNYRRIYSVKGAKNTFENEQKVGRSIYQWLQQQVNFAPSTVFEVGCGAGGILHFFREQGCRVAGCDYGEEYIRFGQSEGLDLVAGGPETLRQFGHADLIILSHVIEHFLDPVSEMTYLSKLLSSKGLVYVAVPGIFSIGATYGDVGRFLQNAHVWHFCLDSLDYVMSQAKYERLAGDERIRAVYRVSEDTKFLSPNSILHKSILLSLKRVEHLRFVLRLRVKSKAKMLSVLNFAQKYRLYHIVKRMITSGR